MSGGVWPADPHGDMVPVLDASLEAAKMRHPSGKGAPSGVLLNATDRCDACSAAAAYRVMHTQEKAFDVAAQVLDFCGHHWRKNFPAMVDKGWVVIGGNPDMVGDKP